MVKWYVCPLCGKTIDEFDQAYMADMQICKECYELLTTERQICNA